ncbi:hypothetical protein N8867_01480 [Flavobacteriaceae bacterium]|nr:hypothetical protein [Flavobacteriaceae bacterium]MDA9865974.1 hypothetical protein [Flavobacteriaceae bacterium]
MEINPNNINTKLIFRLTNFMISKTATIFDKNLNVLRELVVKELELIKN